jgi:predicted  nucleic acid-binding Zn-ribbon protein
LRLEFAPVYNHPDTQRKQLMTRSIDLYELQETDTAVDAAERRLGEIAQELDSESNIAALDEQIATFEAEASQAEREQHESDEEVVDLKEKLSALEEKLYSGEVKLPKELKSLQDDVQAHQRQLASSEEKSLALMARVEQTRAELTSAREERQARMVERERLIEALQSERASIDTSLEQLRVRKDRQQERVDRDDLALYERLRRARSGRAVSKVERGTCQGCRISLPTTVFQRARSGLKIVQCTSCERILYVV